MEQTEQEICINFFNQYRMLQSLGQLQDVVIFHIANEQYTNKFYTFKLKHMGLMAGVPDYCILMPGGRVAFIEFKRNAKRKLRDSQQSFKSICDALSIPHCIAYSPIDAFDFLSGLGVFNSV